MPKNKKKGGRKPFDLTAPISTRKQYKREIRAATRLQFKPLQRQIKGEARAEKEQRRRIGGYFDAYGKSVQQAKQATQSAYDKANQTIASQTAASSQADAALRSEIDAAARADAARRGATYDPSTSQTAAQASLSRRSASDSFGALVAGQGATQSAYLADKKRIGEGERINQLLRSKARSRSLNADKRELAREKGAFRTDISRQIRGEERQYALENLALKGQKADRRTQLKVAKQYGKNDLRAQAANRRAIRLQGRQSRKTDSQKFGHWGNQGSKGGGKGKGGQKVDQTHVRQMLGTLGPVNNKSLKRYREVGRRATIEGLLRINQGYTVAEARAALKQWLKRVNKQVHENIDSPGFR